MVQMSTVWDRTTAFTSQALGAIMPIALLLLFVPISIQLSLQPLLLGAGVAPRMGVLALFWIVELLGLLAIVVLALGATNRAGAAVRAALPRLAPAIGIFLILGFVAMLLAAPMAIVMGRAGVALTALQGGSALVPGAISRGTAQFLLVYALLYVVLVVAATARLVLIEPVILAERRGLAAIGRAFALTRGLTWRIIGVILLYAIVASVAVLAAQTVFGSILRLVAPDDGDIGIASVITAIIVAAVSVAFKVLAAIFVAKLYLAATAHAEGLAEPS